MEGKAEYGHENQLSEEQRGDSILHASSVIYMSIPVQVAKIVVQTLVLGLHMGTHNPHQESLNAITLLNAHINVHPLPAIRQ